MAQYFEKIRSLAGDYSGAAAVLYDLNGMLIFCDASACMGGFLFAEDPIGGNDELRVFSASLREKQVVMGIDKKLKKDAVRTYKEVGGDFIGIIGTPVSSVIGADHAGIGREIVSQLCEEGITEEKLPVIAVDTCGWELYDSGQEKAYLQLVDTIIDKESKLHIDVNVIGATPLDMWDYNQIEDCLGFLKQAGAKKPCIWGGNGGLNEIAGAANAKLNIAVSASAIKVVKALKKKYGTPYLIGYPLGEKQVKGWTKIIKEALKGELQVEEAMIVEKSLDSHDKGKRALIIYEQVTANMLRKLLKEEFDFGTVDVASFFKMDESLMQENDLHIKEESVLKEHINKFEKYDFVIADPFCFKLLPYEPEQKMMFPHIGVSAVFYVKESPNLFGEKASIYMKNILND